jgi:hypothetical protein
VGYYLAAQCLLFVRDSYLSELLGSFGVYSCKLLLAANSCELIIVSFLCERYFGFLVVTQGFRVFAQGKSLSAVNLGALVRATQRPPVRFTLGHSPALFVSSYRDLPVLFADFYLSGLLGALSGVSCQWTLRALCACLMALTLVDSFVLPSQRCSRSSLNKTVYKGFKRYKALRSP